MTKTPSSLARKFVIFLNRF